MHDYSITINMIYVDQMEGQVAKFFFEETRTEILTGRCIRRPIFNRAQSPGFRLAEAQRHCCRIYKRIDEKSHVASEIFPAQIFQANGI